MHCMAKWTHPLFGVVLFLSAAARASTGPQWGSFDTFVSEKELADRPLTRPLEILVDAARRRTWGECMDIGLPEPAGRTVGTKQRDLRETAAQADLVVEGLVKTTISGDLGGFLLGTIAEIEIQEVFKSPEDRALADHVAVLLPGGTLRIRDVCIRQSSRFGTRIPKAGESILLLVDVGAEGEAAGIERVEALAPESAITVGASGIADVPLIFGPIGETEASDLRAEIRAAIASGQGSGAA